MMAKSVMRYAFLSILCEMYIVKYRTGRNCVSQCLSLILDLGVLWTYCEPRLASSHDLPHTTLKTRDEERKHATPDFNAILAVS